MVLKGGVQVEISCRTELSNYLAGLKSVSVHYQLSFKCFDCLFLQISLIFLFMQGTLLDFFGVPVKAYEMLVRSEELQLLAKRVARYKDPVTQFRLMIQHKTPQWSKSCGWTSSKCCHHFLFESPLIFLVLFCITNYFSGTCR